jgi:hypothetical protein
LDPQLSCQPIDVAMALRLAAASSVLQAFLALPQVDAAASKEVEDELNALTLYPDLRLRQQGCGEALDFLQAATAPGGVRLRRL